MASVRDEEEPVWTSAVWFNRQALRLIHFPAAPEGTTGGGAWRADFDETGALRVSFVDGTEERFEVESGDSLVSHGDGMYLLRHREAKARG